MVWGISFTFNIYNNYNYDTVFSGNVILDYDVHKIYCERIDAKFSENLAVISNIGEILENEPKDLNNFLALSNIKYLYNEYTEIYEKQLKIFGAEIDTLLKNVLWPERF